jgi:hypothetical protein
VLKTSEVTNIARLALEKARDDYHQAIKDGTDGELAEARRRLDQAQRIHAAAEAWGAAA